ncbi:DUF4476 domain-containing protein [Paraflavitalea sp. CAU 1676]|uniref:DUF4476 domain-containing protein n=1 Tax=Paraflavitalea sp. CAU 1676 TaxID=3032598 RepID=UPI0023DAAB84|nr:DUF4476 domain-containing protein [Paraflavitalea sp. CAU 1676]MDF2193740.1 hypothetical protein [Paraflavitalea sp. CAU 1676]
MKRIAFVIGLLTTVCSIAQAQSDYYIFVMADNQQPFYARLNDRIYSSSSIGHLVIPQLKDTTYQLYLGFPKKQYSEQLYVISFNNKDLDYQLRHTDGDGWQLVNAQTHEQLKPRQGEAAKLSLPGLGERKTGAFAILMSGLVNDSAVLYKTLAKTDPPVQPAAVSVKTELPTAATQTKEAAPVTGGSLTTVTESPVRDSVQPAPVSVAAAIPAKDSIEKKIDSSLAANHPAPQRSVVLQVQEWWNDKGKGFIYYDSTSAGIDTISLTIEFDKNAGKATPQEVIAAPARVDSLKTATIDPDTVATDQAKTATATVAAKDSTKETTKEIAKETTTAGSLPAPDTTVQKAVAAATSAAAADKPTDKATEKTAEKLAVDSQQNPTGTGTEPTAKTQSPQAVAKPSTVTAADSATKVQAAAKTAASETLPERSSTENKTAPPVTAEVADAKTAAETVKKDSIAKSQAEARKTLLLMNSDCVNFANESDVDKLRVKMLSAANTEERIGAAKKIFKTKCFVTRYIRGLSELFPSDEAKFQFFDAAYPYVSDSGSFRSLIDLFTEDLYIARFKALVRM